MSSEDWAGRARAATMARIAVTQAEVGVRFPLYADPRSGTWTTTGHGSWAGGFWAGLLWLRARDTGHEADRRAAAECTARLESRLRADTATRGLVFWYGTALAEGDAAASLLRHRAARACLADFDARAGIVPWGGAFGGPRMLARVDGVPGTVPLLACAGPAGAAAAAAHLDRHLDLCLGGVGERRPLAWRFGDGDGTWSPCGEPRPGWSRGRAWLLLALADALLRPEVAARCSVRLEAAVERLVAWDDMVTGPPVPPAEGADPDGPSDTSAAAITAVALLKLGRLPGAWTRACARRGVAILSRLAEAHLSREGDGLPAGMLLDGCYDAGKGLAVRHELVWGDFFLALGLASLDGLVDLTRV
ncbi:sugar ABC transporter permease [Streptomyces racemochromogenes]|uniref:Sugar ABC transporter permease n=1 Tax=Streptomyces racemochromogenes TaxID=67353 RepID=A0ABW7PHI1_9ACTN